MPTGGDCKPRGMCGAKKERSGPVPSWLGHTEHCFGLCTAQGVPGPAGSPRSARSFGMLGARHRAASVVRGVLRGASAGGRLWLQA